MAYKTTTDPFVLRGQTDLTITGSSAGVTTLVDTSLDTLNREVLIIHEVDIQGGQFPVAGMNAVATSATPAAIEIHDSVQTATGSLQLNSPDYIAGKNTNFFGFAAGVNVQENRNPDSTAQASKDEVPLAIITDSQIVLRSGFSSGLTLSTSDTYKASFRIICQRAKADADTYAALVTGLL